MSFIAKFTSDCDDCDSLVRPGDEARMVDYERGIVAHVTCPAPTPSRTERSCERCLLVHAGECF